MFQFPRCPLLAHTSSARPCAGRVAPFGDLRITGCQRLPGAFRRVATSFVGRQRLGIHHALFIRRPCSAPRPSRRPFPRRSAPDRLAPAGTIALPAPRRLRLAPSPLRPSFGSVSRPPAFRSGLDFCFTCSARGPPGTPPRHTPRVRPVTALNRRHRQAMTSGGSHGRETARVPRGALSRCGWAGPDNPRRPRACTPSGCTPARSVPRVEPRGFEPRTSAVQGRRSPG